MCPPPAPASSRPRCDGYASQSATWADDAMEPGFHCVRAHWIRGFMTFQRVRRTSTVMLMVPVGPVGNPLDRRGAEFVRARAQPDRGPVGAFGFRQFAGDAGVEPGQVI